MHKVLFLAANPVGMTELNLKAEARAIRKSLEQANLGYLFDIECHWHTRLDQVKLLLLRHRPCIVHFSGHGGEQGQILFEDEERQAAPASPDALNDLFAQFAGDREIRCVLLNACFTKSQAEGIARSIPCVVGTTSAIDDASAIAFAAGFYQMIGFGRDVQRAFDSGRNEVLQRGRKKDVRVLRLEMSDGIEPRDHFILPKTRPATKVRGKQKLHGKYFILGCLGEGPIAKVDVAWDIQLERKVAVKSLTEAAALKFFEDEARDIARVAKHPNILSIYGAWLDDAPPHYVRQYIDGNSLRAELETGEKGPFPIDFVQQVLSSLGDAMLFAQQMGVEDLGVRAEKILIEKMKPELNLGQSSHYNIIVCPDIAEGRFVSEPVPGKIPDAKLVCLPPESFSERVYGVDFEKANQYRLGIIGYEMLVGAERFRAVADERLDLLRAGRAARFPGWPRVDVSKYERCPSFLSDAIDRMIDPDPAQRYQKLGDAVEAISRRDLDVEIARDSFRRILGTAQSGRPFFHAFYSRLLAASGGIRKEFHSVFGQLKPLEALKTSDSGKNWPDQFTKLMESIVLLFAFRILKETQGHTILTSIAKTHRYRAEYYTHFRDALLETVLEYDTGNYPDVLRSAWEKAIAPGLQYLETHQGTG